MTQTTACTPASLPSMFAHYDRDAAIAWLQRDYEANGVRQGCL